MTDWVYEEVRQAIIELRLKPGEALREAAIAEQLGVSKTPVREALARLEQEGLVETTSFKGAVVSGYSPEDLQEIYELRELLEGAAARAAAASASDETLTRLASLVAESRELHAKDDLAGLAALLGAFDLVIYEQVTGHDCQLLPGIAVITVGTLTASESTVRMLQRVAHETVARFRTASR